MLNAELARQIAQSWIDAWNHRDLDAIMQHYGDNVEFSSPAVIQRWGEQTQGRLVGKAALRKHFARGLELQPKLRFDLVDVLVGIDAVTILYRRQTGVLAADIVELSADGTAHRGAAFYQAVVPRT